MILSVINSLVTRYVGIQMPGNRTMYNYIQVQSDDLIQSDLKQVRLFRVFHKTDQVSIICFIGLRLARNNTRYTSKYGLYFIVKVDSRL